MERSLEQCKFVKEALVFSKGRPTAVKAEVKFSDSIMGANGVVWCLDCDQLSDGWSQSEHLDTFLPSWWGWGFHRDAL